MSNGMLLLITCTMWRSVRGLFTVK